jgi:hypothetical protein
MGLLSFVYQVAITVLYSITQQAKPLPRLMEALNAQMLSKTDFLAI